VNDNTNFVMLVHAVMEFCLDLLSLLRSKFWLIWDWSNGSEIPGIYHKIWYYKEMLCFLWRLDLIPVRTINGCQSSLLTAESWITKDAAHIDRVEGFDTISSTRKIMHNFRFRGVGNIKKLGGGGGLLRALLEWKGHLKKFSRKCWWRGQRQRALCHRKKGTFENLGACPLPGSYAPTFSWTFTDSFQISVMSPQQKSNPCTFSTTYLLSL
jgi:hypothetical protein